MSVDRGIVDVTAGPAHAAFVRLSFRDSLRDLSTVPRAHIPAHVEMLERCMRGGGRVLVATPAGHPDTYLGWAAEQWGSLLFAWVPRELRHLGIARHLVARLFTGGPVRLVYWTSTAQKVQRHGFPIVLDWDELAKREKQAARIVKSSAQPRNERTA